MKAFLKPAIDAPYKDVREVSAWHQTLAYKVIINGGNILMCQIYYWDLMRWNLLSATTYIDNITTHLFFPTCTGAEEFIEDIQAGKVWFARKGYVFKSYSDG